MSCETLSLDAKLDQNASAPLKNILLAKRGQDLEVDASKVTLISALATQVLRAAARTWAEDGKTLRIVNPSNDCEDQLRLLGFTPETLTKWEAA